MLQPLSRVNVTGLELLLPITDMLSPLKLFAKSMLVAPMFAPIAIELGIDVVSVNESPLAGPASGFQFAPSLQLTLSPPPSQLRGVAFALQAQANAISVTTIRRVP